MRIAAPNRHELWISFALAFVAMGQSSIPIHFVDSLILATGLIVATFCALNAFLDRDEMNGIERAISAAWLSVLTILTPFVICTLGSIKTFANR